MSLPTVLAQFTSIRKCDLAMQISTSGRSNISLWPFEDLPHLQHLRIADAAVHDLNAAMHLTHLQLQNCRAFCSRDCSCVTSLLRLDVLRSSVASFHQRGIAACSNLMHLSLKRGCVVARDATETVRLNDNHRMQLPPGLSELTGLTELDFTHLSSHAEVQLSWLTDLPALESCSITGRKR